MYKTPLGFTYSSSSHSTLPCSQQFIIVILWCSTLFAFQLVSDNIVNTSTDECGDGDVRLVDGDSSNEGRVELCLRQRWGSISDEGWSAEEAQVVCKQLGFTTQGSLLS